MKARQAKLITIELDIQIAKQAIEALKRLSHQGLLIAQVNALDELLCALESAEQEQSS